jgi:hypothetical protein
MANAVNQSHLQGDFLIELPTNFKAPSSWAMVSATKRCNRFRPPEVVRAVAAKDCAQERLEVRFIRRRA